VDDALNENPGLTGAELKFESDTIQDKYAKTCHNQLLSLYAYQLGTDGKIIENSGIDLSGNLKGNKIEWQSPAEGNWIVTQVYSVAKKPSLDPMHPLSGKSYVKHFFQRFEDRFPEQSKGGLNFFFSDELNFNLHGYIWNSIFRDEFRKRKGYDIVPYLTALFTHIGPITPKIRLDYNDVMVSLSEENFFIPVYQWHEDRNLIYGCDHGGRGKDVSEFGDYFRTQRWNQAPGCDQPNLGKDIIKNKVASSIAHLYKRPRVWLEGFHSSNWDTNTANLTDATFANFVMGQNLLSLHGFYYSTMGGWWEWAPPCNHTHMPYWEEMGPFLECTERLSYILSQGYHRADVAILYPVESVVAGYDQTAVQKAFSLGEYLYREGVDFDFMDYESLAKASIKNSKIHISGEEFKVLIIPSMKAIRHSSLKKALQFKQNGGIVINLGELPEATEKKGLNDPEVRSLLNKLFGPDSKNTFVAKENQEVLDILDTNLTRDFRILSQQPQKDMPYIMHRKLGNKDLYAVYNIPSGTECFFHATGGIELWDPWTGKTKEITASKTTDKGTIIQMPMEKQDLHLFVFDPAKKAIIAEVPQTSVSKTILLDGEWSFDLKPSLNNKFGDFHWPATDELLGAYIYKARYNQASSETADWQSPSFDDSGWKSQTFTYGTKFMILEATPELSEKELLTHLPYQSNRVQIDNKEYTWKPYEFSWRWGVENDYGHQGWHGLKATVHDEFIRMGKLEKEFRETVRVEDPNGNKNYYLYSNVLAPETGNYQLIFGELKPADIYINGKTVSPSTSTVTLNRGTNEIVLHYDTFGVTYCVVRKAGDTPRILKEVTAEKPLATNFRGDLSLLPFDINKTEEPTYGQYRFTSAPGLKKLEFSAFGETKIWVNGALCNLSVKEKRPDGLIRYEAVMTNPSKRISTVAISIKEPWGNAGGAAIDGPIKQTCGDGLISAGDWTQIEGLSTYSGGAWYRKNIHLEKNNGDKVYLNLGQVVSTAEVWVNKQKAGLKLTPPWRFDITEYIKEGDNQIEILLYNTAANYYLSVPTMYRGSTKAGLLGTASIEIVR
ncbi:glycosyl hydrolase, partial [Parabacteroides goldsteinii]